MASDILTSLELDKDSDPGKVIVIKEINGCDSSFIINCVLGHCIKMKNPLLVLLTHNSFLHYHNIGLKMNYNLQKAVDGGLIQFYNVGSVLVNNTIENINNSSNDIINTIKQEITSMSVKYGSVNVIFEGVSHLFDFHFDLKQVNILCKDIIDLVRIYNHSFAIFHCYVAMDDDVTNILANLLTHKGQILAEVESLSSGLSTDVSGHITFKYLYQKYQVDHFYVTEPKTSQYLFKLFDRGVKLLAPGTI